MTIYFYCLSSHFCYLFYFVLFIYCRKIDRNLRVCLALSRHFVKGKFALVEKHRNISGIWNKTSTCHVFYARYFFSTVRVKAINNLSILDFIGNIKQKVYHLPMPHVFVSDFNFVFYYFCWHTLVISTLDGVKYDNKLQVW